MFNNLIQARDNLEKNPNVDELDKTELINAVNFQIHLFNLNKSATQLQKDGVRGSFEDPKVIIENGQSNKQRVLSMLWGMNSNENIISAVKTMIREYNYNIVPNNIRYCMYRTGFEESVVNNEDYTFDLAIKGTRCHIFFNCTEEECGIDTKDLPIEALNM